MKTFLNRPLKLWHMVAVLGLLGAIAVAGSTLAARGGSGQQPYIAAAYLTVPAKGTATGQSACRKGDEPTGGGALYGFGGPDVLDLRQSSPWDGNDANQVPEDGWLVSIKNEGSSDSLVSVLAVCE